MQSRTKIGLVLDRFDPIGGGLEQWTASLARFLADRGHDVHVIAFEQAEHDVPVTMHLLPTAPHVIARARLIDPAVRALGAHVVHDTGTGWAGDVFHPQTGSRLLSQARLVATHPPAMRLRAAISPVSMLWRHRAAALERHQIRRAHRVIAVSRLVRSVLAAQHRLPPGSMTLIPNGAHTSRFTPARLDPLRQPTRDRLGLGDATVFLASAFNLHLKGVDTAMRALAPLVAEGLAVRLLVAGGEPGIVWPALAAQLGLQRHVKFLGAVADMEPLFAAADVLLHATRWDACSLSTIEAAAAGLPVVTTATNGAAELIEHGRTGIVLPDPEDSAALTAQLRTLLDPAVRARIGQAARAASSAHDIRHNLVAVEATLLNIADRRRAEAGQ